MRYSQQQLEHFHNTQHAGKLDENDPSVILTEMGNAESGNVIRLYLQIRNKKIIAAKFLAFGSVAVIACSEYICRYLEGKTIDAAQQLTATQIMQGLGMLDIEIHAASLAARAVKKSLH